VLQNWTPSKRSTTCRLQRLYSRDSRIRWRLPKWKHLKKWPKWSSRLRRRPTYSKMWKEILPNSKSSPRRLRTLRPTGCTLGPIWAKLKYNSGTNYMQLRTWWRRRRPTWRRSLASMRNTWQIIIFPLKSRKASDNCINIHSQRLNSHLHLDRSLLSLRTTRRRNQNLLWNRRKCRKRHQ